MRPILSIALCLTCLGSTVPAASSDVRDTESPDAIVKALYDVISGPAGAKRDWDRMRSLFSEEAKMVAIGRKPDGSSVRRVLTLEDYVKLAGPALESRGFFEKEIARRTESFGNMVQVWTTYESRIAKDDAKPFERGINSLQLWNDGKRWWILGIVWQGESANLTLPAKYLKGGSR
ncbi:MAG: hypothetical protein IT203_09465 [Fimbriimonadaceae bacterium]|nr:hypothetical protein [Fimbriimonadaceae bacterium]